MKEKEKEMKRKIFETGWAVLLAGLMVFSLSVCKRESGSQVSSGVASVKGSLPLVSQKTTMSVFLGESGGANIVGSYSYADNLFTKKVTDETNIEFTWTIASQANKREQLNILLNAGNYPEIIITDTLGYGEMVYYAAQGILQPLDEYDPLSYPRIKAAFDEFPALNQIVRGSDGKMYTLPAVNDCLHCIYASGRMWLYWPWAQENNRKFPETLDEFTEYLRWIKNTDLNKNGRNDEIPLVFEGQRHIENFISAFAKPFLPFVLSGGYFGLALENSKVVEQYKDPRFREALKYLAGLYNEGLLLADSFSMTQDQMRSLVSADTPVVGVSGSMWMQHHTVLPSRRFYEFFEVRALQGPGGLRHASNSDPWSIMRGCMYVTDKAKNPELAVALYDYFIKFDVSLDSYIGPKGTAWTDVVSPGALSILNTPATHRMLMTYGSQTFNTTWDQAAPMIRNMTFRAGEEATDVPLMVDFVRNRNLTNLDSLLNNMSFTNEGAFYLTSELNKPYDIPVSMFIPPTAFNDDDNARLADINAVLVDYKRQAMVGFIIGRWDINNDRDWNNYLAELDRNGAAELAGIIQKYIK